MKGSTYSNPTPKINTTPIFCLHGKVRVVNTGMGKRNIVRSVAMFRLALSIQIGFFGRQRSWIEESQKPRTGMQKNILLRTVQIL